MNTQTKDIYSEVYSLLNLFGKEYTDKMPSKLLNIIEAERNKEYTPIYDISKDINSQNIKKETKAMIALLKLSYWCDSVNEKQKLMQLFNDNESIYQQELREKYNPDNIFKDKSNLKQNVDTTQTMSIVEYKENFWKKLINKIKRYFKR